MIPISSLRYCQRLAHGGGERNSANVTFPTYAVTGMDGCRKTRGNQCLICCIHWQGRWFKCCRKVPQRPVHGRGYVVSIIRGPHQGPHPSRIVWITLPVLRKGTVSTSRQFSGSRLAWTSRGLSGQRSQALS